ncbi:DoxX family protein [Dyella mobilis]|uniref:DoxX family protein n=1 Tax=Dyella mobilis TaxID=1849582 RepID=UPI00195891AF|nr:DoxX family protein [Dyella mobilis]GLQ99349.1 hypothetical protein GCM10007863_37690 [Dyella mobilis]
MATVRAGNPYWVAALLSFPWVAPLLRVALASAYVIGGVDKLMHFHDAMLEQQHFGLNPGWLWAAITVVVELGGSLCVIVNRWVWLGAGGLGVLTVVAMVVANDFWNLSGAAHFGALNSFFENLGLIAALVMATQLADKRKNRSL